MSISISASTDMAIATDQRQTKVLLLSNQLGSDHLVSALNEIETITIERLGDVENILTSVSMFSPDVLILAVQFLNRSIINQLTKLHQKSPLPVIVAAQESAPNVVETVVSAGVSSYLVDKVSAKRLSIIIDLSIARFNMEQNLLSELQVTKEKLSDRKLIERAKGIIMQQKHLTEEDAYNQMRKSAMDQGQSMADLAKRVISVFEMLG